MAAQRRPRGRHHRQYTIKAPVAIGTVLADMDTALTALEARRDKARQLEQGMMQALLKGRIRLV